MACHFKDTLHYSSPANGGRGIVRTGMLIPESVELFVCPFACGRHGAISAVKQDLKHRLSYLYVEQADIVNGYDDLIVPAVGELLETLQERPKVILIFVSCLDDLIGTDHEALQEKLAEAYPDIRFRSCHMNPISKGSKTPPAISIQNNTFGLLDRTEETDRYINCIATLREIEAGCEIYEILKLLGYEGMRHITQYDTFEGFQDMAKSSFNLVITPVGKQAAEQMQKKHGMPWAFLPVSYRMEEIESSYRQLVQSLSSAEWSCENGKAREEIQEILAVSRQKAEAAIARAKEAVGDTPLIVDASAVKSPFGLARALVEYGFTVARIQTPECIGIDKANYEWIVREHPEIEILQSHHHNVVKRDNQVPESIAIGVDGAYLAGSDYVADLFDDEGVYGYYGICCLMEKLEHAKDQKVDLEAMIHEYGLVV